ncbi:hypothetical protein C8R43DRAFT_1136496 [Mycena crocata]|nr:hypothetical protein C8R43DRAFT_1136496 [Mycena crocata]
MARIKRGYNCKSSRQSVVSYSPQRSPSPSAPSTLSSDDLAPLGPADFEETPRYITPTVPDIHTTLSSTPPTPPPVTDDDTAEMTGSGDKMFYGDGRIGDYNPRDYLKKVKRDFFGKTVSERGKVDLFGYLLASGHVAESWYDGLDDVQKATWAGLEAEFDKKWPKEAMEEKSAQELSDDMMALEMREDEMGKRVDVDGVLVFSHVRWAKQMRLLCDKDTAGLLIPQVRRQLPLAMRSSLHGARCAASLPLYVAA